MSETVNKISQRLNSIDFLRGFVMIIMLLDHVREFVHTDAFKYNPLDLSKTNTMLFFTRFVTHICAPTFVFLAGTSIYLQKMRGKTGADLSKFLLTRGLWLIILEFTVVRFSMVFNLDYSFLGFAEVIWMFGVSMIVLAALVFLPVRVVGIIGVAMIGLHHLMDLYKVPPATAFALKPPPDFWEKIWIFLHQPGNVPLFDGATFIFVAYPVIPWIGVMAAGYWFGCVYDWESEHRRKFLFKLGAAMLILFVVINTIAINATSFFPPQETLWLKFLSFINVTKYPPSVLFLLLMLGISILILAVADKIRNVNFLTKIVVTFGRVPLFYFILQMFYAHGVAVVLNRFAGNDTAFLFANFPDSANAPLDSGFSLWVVYAAWIAGLIILYPICSWYAKIKKGRSGFPFSYI